MKRPIWLRMAAGFGVAVGFGLRGAGWLIWHAGLAVYYLGFELTAAAAAVQYPEPAAVDLAPAPRPAAQPAGTGPAPRRAGPAPAMTTRPSAAKAPERHYSTRRPTAALKARR